MQEEGWVVCRAFKKPSPSHMRPGYEAAQCYFRDHEISHGRPSISSFSEVLNQTHHFLNNNNSHHHHHHHHHQSLISLDQHQHQHQQLIDLPQLDSPSLGMRPSPDNNYGQTNNINHIGEEYYSDDVESLDQLFASNLTDTSTSVSDTSFFAHSNNFPMNMILPHHNQASHALGLCFPDSS